MEELLDTNEYLLEVEHVKKGSEQTSKETLGREINKNDHRTMLL